jgi:hypothetical protein
VGLSTYDILIIQKCAIHIIAGAGKLDHCCPIFKDITILPVISLYIFYCLLYIKANLDLVDMRGTVHTYGTQSRETLNLPRRMRLHKNDTSVLIRSKKLYNKLPEGVCALDSKLFRSKILYFLRNNCF